MQQLTGLDQIFIGLNTGTTDAVVGALIQFDPPQPGQPVPDEVFMRGRLHERLDYLPPFHEVMQKVPLGLDFDYLAEAERVDVAKHLGTVRLPAPGTREQLAAEVGRIMGTPLDRTRPLWDYTVFEGVQDGGVAHLLRVDHAACDGTLLTKIFDTLADDPPELTLPEHRVDWPEPLFGPPEMLARGLFGLARRPFLLAKMQVGGIKYLIRRYPEDGWTTVPASLAKIIPGDFTKPLVNFLNKRARAAGRTEIAPVLPTLFPPRTPFNRRVSAKRIYAFSELSLSQSLMVGKTFGTTLNNVVVSVVAGAMRRYLQDRELPTDKPLIVCCPVSLRKGDEKEPWANWIFMMWAPMATDEADPLDRLKATTRHLTTAKKSFDALPTELMREGSKLLPRDFFGAATQVLVRAPKEMSRTQWNLTVSNVRGPAQVNTMNGLTVASYHPAAFLTVGGTINISLWSYRDTIGLGLVGAPEQAQDLWPLTQYLQDELDALVALAEQHKAAGPTQEPAAATKPRARRARVRAVS